MTATISKDARQDIFDLVYQELRRIARSQRRALGAAATLQTTALVHETYLKLHDAAPAQALDRVHFLSLAARAMRQILIDHARSRARLKRGGDIVITGLHEDVGAAADVVDLMAHFRRPGNHRDRTPAGLDRAHGVPRLAARARLPRA